MRRSKTRALKALEAIYTAESSTTTNSNGSNGNGSNDTTGAQNKCRDADVCFYDQLNSLFEVNNNSSDNKKISSTNRLSVSNIKKKFLVSDYVNNRFVQTEIIMSKGKGNGVKAINDIEPGVLVVEYKGELIGKQEALKRERLYAHTSTTRRMDCYLFFFEHKGRVMCVDPTIPSEDLGHGRYINHKVKGNLEPIKIIVDGAPKIVLISSRHIASGEELFFDYGDRSSSSLTYFPWLREDFTSEVDDTVSSSNNSNNNCNNDSASREQQHVHAVDENAVVHHTRGGSSSNGAGGGGIGVSNTLKRKGLYSDSEDDQDESAYSVGPLLNNTNVVSSDHDSFDNEPSLDDMSDLDLDQSHTDGVQDNDDDEDEDYQYSDDYDDDNDNDINNKEDQASDQQQQGSENWKTKIYELSLPSGTDITSEVSNEHPQLHSLKRIKLKFKQRDTSTIPSMEGV
ncbi:hypothetical protein SAMD00019534_023110 [Acytostelium subglobosum LB1]|uniref:hypothetical protein n=1 Tax=Acytostelium subglobosum LB1 TaxID=1410327 RepID=UPI0006451CE7|nr:hypothetical protein SAMD00019534_023110 [Acytostelium subglobosum LB1]GAM19136.1 hypothetical protein SAMD00019534_023110 [Acytostelium subglobosum LB1]|eukprot:XP_012757063.1 hypothetical protein SAMD00019534_023110 [Acytostelium subglobosum LB1]